MEANAHRPSAKILAFPTGGRRNAQFLSAKAKFAAELRAIEGKEVLAETAWYHQEALDSVDGTRSN